MPAAADGQRLRRAEIDDEIARRRVVARVGESSQPSERLAAVGYARVPEPHRGKVREARMVVAAAMNDRDRPVLAQPVEPDHRLMEPESISPLDRVALPNADRRPGAVIGGVAVGNDGIESIVAARQLDDDEDALGMFFDARAAKRLRGEDG